MYPYRKARTRRPCIGVFVLATSLVVPFLPTCFFNTGTSTPRAHHDRSPKAVTYFPHENVAHEVLWPASRISTGAPGQQYQTIQWGNEGSEHLIRSIYESVRQSVASVKVQQGDATVSMGSGLVWDTDGHIVTNYHVIQNDGDVILTIANVSHGAIIVNSDPDRDLAVLRISNSHAPSQQPPALTPVPRGSTKSLQIGQSILAIGHPFALLETATPGFITGLQRNTPGPTGLPITNCIQVDASLNPGNSGGGLFGTSGKLLGIPQSIRQGGGGGTGFVIPVEAAEELVQAIADGSFERRPWLGLQVSSKAESYKVFSEGIDKLWRHRRKQRVTTYVRAKKLGFQTHGKKYTKSKTAKNATVLEFNKAEKKLKVRLDSGSEQWVPIAWLTGKPAYDDSAKYAFMSTVEDLFGGVLVESNLNMVVTRKNVEVGREVRPSGSYDSQLHVGKITSSCNDQSIALLLQCPDHKDMMCGVTWQQWNQTTGKNDYGGDGMHNIGFECDYSLEYVDTEGTEVQHHDIITHVDDIRVEDLESFVAAVRSRRSGDTVELTFTSWRRRSEMPNAGYDDIAEDMLSLRFKLVVKLTELSAEVAALSQDHIGNSGLVAG